MSQHDADPQSAQPAPPEIVTQEIRIDGAHAIQGHAPPESAAAEVVAVSGAARQAEQEATPAREACGGPPEHSQALLTAQRLYTQATQLAAQLQSRQETLDRREAHVNARLAQLDQGTRAARLWVNEREAEIGSRRQRLEAQEKDAAKRIQRLAGAEAALDHKTAELARCEEDLGLRGRRVAEQTVELAEARRRQQAEAERAETALVAERQQIDAQRAAALEVVRLAMAGLERRRVAIEAQAEKLEREARVPPVDLVAREEQLGRDRQSLQERASVLEQAEARLAATGQEAERLAAELRKQQAALDEAGRAERRRIEIEERRALAELERQREAVVRRSRQVDQAQAAMEQLRAELGQVHRESLELRLATEQVWLQLSASVSPVELTRSLAEIRARLADAYRDANGELRRRKEDLEAIRDQLAQQHEELLGKKHELDAWAERRQTQIEEMAQRLVTREQELHQQEIELADRARSLELQRLASV